MDLTTHYLGLRLDHPFVAAASPLTATLDGMRRLEDSGAAAVVMASLFQEQIDAEDTAYTLLTDHGGYSQAEAQGYFPELPDYDKGINGQLETLRRATESLGIPVIASINCIDLDSWIDYARKVEQAGAAAIELNFFALPDLDSNAAEIESGLIDIVAGIRKSVRIPLAAKITCHFTAIGDMCTKLAAAGADGLVLFNSSHQPDIDLKTLDIVHPRELEIGSTRLVALWIGLLSPRIKASFAGCGGVANHEDVVKYLLTGADAVMVTSPLLNMEPQYLEQMKTDLKNWLGHNGFASVRAIQGLRNASHFHHAEALLRARHIASTQNYVPKRLVG